MFIITSETSIHNTDTGINYWAKFINGEIFLLQDSQNQDLDYVTTTAKGTYAISFLRQVLPIEDDQPHNELFINSIVQKWENNKVDMATCENCGPVDEICREWGDILLCNNCVVDAVKDITRGELPF